MQLHHFLCLTLSTISLIRATALPSSTAADDKPTLTDAIVPRQVPSSEDVEQRKRQEFGTWDPSFVGWHDPAAQAKATRYPHQPAVTVRHADADADAEADADAGPIAEAESNTWCHRKGESCWKKLKRSAFPMPEPEAKAEAGFLSGRSNWCNRRGEPCWKVKRAADALADALADADADASLGE
ncbi:MAG: hypothetical protein LQ340_005336 [Diploschistes diacapsis]|nr:MAG: hypothetical protein LQ340_005336 [Diploschistes diacapsis]